MKNLSGQDPIAQMVRANISTHKGTNLGPIIS